MQNEKKSLQSELDSLRSVWSTDLTGDGKKPVLITLQWGGGSMGNYYGAYLYDPEDDKMKRLPWDQDEVVIGLLEDKECNTGSIVIEDRSLKPDGNNRPFYQRWIFKMVKWSQLKSGMHLYSGWRKGNNDNET